MLAAIKGVLDRLPDGDVPCLKDVPCLDEVTIGRTSAGSFSAVSKPSFARKYAFESSRRDLQNALLCTVLESNLKKGEKPRGEKEPGPTPGKQAR